VAHVEHAHMPLRARLCQKSGKSYLDYKFVAVSRIWNICSMVLAFGLILTRLSIFGFSRHGNRTHVLWRRRDIEHTIWPLVGVTWHATFVQSNAGRSGITDIWRCSAGRSRIWL